MNRLTVNEVIHFPPKLVACLLVSLFFLIIFTMILYQNFISLFQYSEALIRSFVTPDTIDDVIVKIRQSFLIAFGIITTLFILIFIFINVSVVTKFKNMVIEMRRGIYQFDIKSHDSYDSLNMIGGFIANTIFSFYVFFVFMAIIITPFCFKEFYIILWGLRDYWLNKVILMMVNIVIHMVLGKIMTDGTHFRFRCCYQFYEFYKIVTGFIISFITGLIRYLILIVILVISLFRVDSSVVPIWVSRLFFFNLDFVNRRYFGFLKCYHAHNHPIVHTVGMLFKAKQFTNQNDSNEDEEVLTPKQRQIAFKWQLCALLVRNPSLVDFRKHNSISKSDIDKNTDQRIVDKKNNFYNKVRADLDVNFNDSEKVGFKR